MVWTPSLIQLFHDIKVCITSSLVLARFDPSKPTFLKTDWSAEGMGWVLMQPAGDEESIAATKLLSTTGECKFDLTKGGAHLHPIGFGSRYFFNQEKNTISLLVKQLVVGGKLVRIGVIYGVPTFGCYVIVNLSKIFLIIMVQLI